MIERLGQLPGVVAVEAVPDGFLVEQARGVDARGALSAAAIGAGWSVIELRPAAGSLEDVFLEVTSAEVSGPETRRAAKRQAAQANAKSRKERR